jgi:23S rRNA (uracil1939-C5)-methyltransferase
MTTEITLTIQSLAAGGAGVGRHAGKVVFVPLTAPGDTIRCEISLDKKRFAHGRLVEVTRPSSVRVAPRCPVFGRCGGCAWQHVGYEGQIEAKRTILIDALTRIAHIDEPPVPAAVRSPREYGYRALVELAFATGGADAVVGFFAPRGSDVVPIEHCPVAAHEIDVRLPSLGRALSACGFAGGGRLRILAGTGGAVSAHIEPNGPARINRDDADRFLTEAALSGLEVPVGNKITSFGNPAISYPGWDGSREIALIARPSGFVQANPCANRELIRVLTSFDFSGKRVLELFSGTGNLTVPMAAAGARVTAVESFGPSVADARRTAESLGVGGIDFVVGDAGAALTGLEGDGARPDVVVLDPPRTGAYRIMERIADLSAPDIIYVSCSPATLARDVSVLIERGYRLVECVPVDMFPQTSHVEAFCRLRKG